MRSILLCVMMLVSMYGFTQTESDKAEVSKLVDELIGSFNTHDFTTLKNNSTEDVSWVNIIGIWWKGRDAVVGGHYAIFDRMFKGVKFEKKEVTIEAVTSDVMSVHVIQHVGEFFPPDGVDRGVNKRPAIDNNLLLIYVKKNGKWLLSTAHNTEVQPAPAPRGNDQKEITEVLEKESTTWRNGDVKAHAECWSVQPYSRVLVSTTDGQCFDVPTASILNPPAGQMGKGGTFKNTNYRFSIGDDRAWVNHDEESTSVDGKKTYSHEFRVLEKIDGKWKIVGQSIHLYVP